MLPPNPLLSLLIATKNRIPFCISAIKSILGSNDTNFELIIQDNSDTKELGSYIDRNILDNRLIYNYTPPPFSSIDNFNSVISLANGEYVCLIGDDDGINPEIFKIVRWAYLNKIEAIVPELNAFYWWPDACRILKDFKEYNGFLRISKFTGSVSQFYTSSEVNKLMKNGGQNYLLFNLPKLYHGIVKKEYLNKIEAITGNFIGGLSPDIYISVALTAHIDRIIKIDYPLTIPGICSLSTSADSGSGKHSGELESAPHFRDRGVYSWSEQVPKFYSVETIWADSAIASLRDLKRFKLMSTFNIATLTVSCLKKHKEYSKVILNNYYENKNSSNRIKKAYCLILLIIKYLELKLVNILSRVVRKFTTKIFGIIKFSRTESIGQASLSNIENICQASEELSKYLSENSLSVDVIIEKLDLMLGNSVRK